jgi:precorrin-8X/cobalt-precorrin-8 methylmutase
MIPNGRGEASLLIIGDALILCRGGDAWVSGVRPGYEKNPANIETRSFEIIRNALSCYAIDPELFDVAVRVVHAGGDFSLASLMGSANNAIESARKAFASGGRIFCDVEMLKAGISSGECSRLGLETVCFIHDDETVQRAKAGGVTRAMASVDIALEQGVGIFAFGNAPSALFRLLERLENGAEADFVCGMPVGFVGAAESKEALVASGVPSVFIRGPRGGSGLCAACMNALLRMA